MKDWLQRNLKGDPIIWTIVLLLSIISILVVYSSTGSLAFKKMGGDTEAYLRKHGSLVLLSWVAMYVAHRIDYRLYAKITRVLLIVSIPLLIGVLFFGRSSGGATRQYLLPFIGLSFQPSDLAKLALISSLAAMLAKRQQNIDDFQKVFVPVLAWVGVICALIAVANFSTAGMLFATCFLLMYMGRVPGKYLTSLVLVGIFAIGMALILGQRWGTFVSRISTYSKMVTDNTSEEITDKNSQDELFQARQSYIAISTGGFLGKGVGHSEQRNILPLAYSDYIFAIIVEEFGLVGGGFVVFLYLALLYRSMLAVSRTDRPFGGLLSAGLGFSLVVQAFINMGVAVGLLPVTGQPLPLLSMGGTSLLFTGLAIGIILSVSRNDLQEKAVS
jgi:cell division protein FtsW